MLTNTRCFPNLPKDKKSKLWSLPETLFLFTAFIIGAVLHLNVWEAFKSSRAYQYALTYGALAFVKRVASAVSRWNGCSAHGELGKRGYSKLQPGGRS